MKDFLLKLKAGDYGLAKTYWLYGVVVNIVYKIVDLIITAASYEVSILVFFIMVGYTYFQIIGLWNAASKYEGLKLWAIIAKILAVLGGLLTIFVVFALITGTVIA